MSREDGRYYVQLWPHELYRRLEEEYPEGSSLHHVGGEEFPLFEVGSGDIVILAAESEKIGAPPFIVAAIEVGRLCEADEARAVLGASLSPFGDVRHQLLARRSSPLVFDRRMPEGIQAEEISQSATHAHTGTVMSVDPALASTLLSMLAPLADTELAAYPEVCRNHDTFLSENGDIVESGDPDGIF